MTWLRWRLRLWAARRHLADVRWQMVRPYYEAGCPSDWAYDDTLAERYLRAARYCRMIEANRPLHGAMRRA